MPVYARRLWRVLAELPEDVVAYKGLAYRDIVVGWLGERLRP